jgi:hypothetical protein
MINAATCKSCSFAKSGSNSAGLLALSTWTCTASRCAASCTDRVSVAVLGLVGLTNTPIMAAEGIASCSSSNSFGPTSTPQLGHPSHVTAGVIEARDESNLHGIGNGAENDWNGRCR